MDIKKDIKETNSVDETNTKNSKKEKSLKIITKLINTLKDIDDEYGKNKL